jgi:hypothetical protein
VPVQSSAFVPLGNVRQSMCCLEANLFENLHHEIPMNL